MDQKIHDEGMKKLLLGVGLALLTYGLGRVVGILCVTYGFDSIMIPIAIRALFAVIFIVALGGRSTLRFSWSDIVETWRFVRPLIIINILIGGLTLVGVIISTVFGELKLEHTLYWGTYTTILCLLVGINEEGMFRGLMLGGLLAKWGETKSGVLKAAVVSSVLFGAWHVIFDLDYTNGWAIATGLMKTLETGMFAFILCYLVIKGKNLWGAIMAHGFFDWIILCGNTIAAGGMEAPTYVSTDPTIAKATLGIFSVMAVLYLPKTIQAAKEMLALDMPQYGPFMSGDTEQ